MSAQPVNPPSAHPPPFKGKLAACLWTPDTSEEGVRSLARRGGAAIEPGPSFLFQEDEESVEAGARRLRSAGVLIYSCHARFGGDSDLSLLEEDKRKAAVAEHEKALARAAVAGAECIVIHPSARLKKEDAPKRLDRLYASLEALLRSSERAGVRLALENMLPGHLCSEAADLRSVVDRFDSPMLGVCFDTGHSRLSRQDAAEGQAPSEARPAPTSVAEAFAAVRERTIAFHLQDTDGYRDTHVQPPYGTVEWPAFVREFRAMDFPHPVAVEAAPWNGSDWRQLVRELEALFSGQLLTVRLGDSRVRVVCDACGHYCFGTPEDWFCACEG
jgi:sugar phosphate isomerase/epimerase